MYSTRLRNDRYLVDCLAVSGNVAIEKFIVDTVVIIVRLMEL